MCVQVCEKIRSQFAPEKAIMLNMKSKSKMQQAYNQMLISRRGQNSLKKQSGSYIHCD